MVKKIFVLSILLIGFDAGAEVCDSGFDVFKKEVIQLTRVRCAECHDGSGPVPHSSPNDQTAYSAAKNYLSFVNPLQSYLLEKAKDGHCISEGGDENCVPTSDELEIVVNEWAKEESKCLTDGHIKTNEITIESGLALYNGFDTESFYSFPHQLLRWSLEEQGFPGLEIWLRAQFVGNRDGSGGFHFSMPAVYTTDKTVRIKGLKVLVNGSYEPIDSSFDNINTVVPSSNGLLTRGRLLSNLELTAASLLGLGLDRVSLAIEEIEEISDFKCNSLDTFKRSVLPKLSNCTSCHSQAASVSYVNPLHMYRFEMDLPEDKLCNEIKSIQRASQFSRSPFWDAIENEEHSGLYSDELVEVREAINEWMAGEGGAQ